MTFVIASNIMNVLVSAYTWVKTATNGLPGSGNYTGLVISSSSINIAVVIGNKVYLSVDSGSTWSAKNSGLPTSATWNLDGNYLLNKLIVADKYKTQGVFYSSDSGNSWGVITTTPSLQSNSVSGNIVAVRFNYDCTKIYLLYNWHNTKCLWVSSNGGVSYTAMTTTNLPTSGLL